MFICDFVLKDKFLGIVVHRFSCVFEFTVVDLLDVKEFLALCDVLARSFESCYFDSHMCKLLLLCSCKGFGNETQNCRRPTNMKDFRV